MSSNNLELFEAKLKEHLRDPHVIYAYHGESMQSYKTGYFCGVADALEEMRPKCSAEVEQNPDDIEESLSSTEASDSVLREECNKLFNDYEGCKQSLLKKCREYEQLEKDFDEAVRARTRLSDQLVLATSQCAVYEAKYKELLEQGDSLTDATTDMVWKGKYDQLEIDFRTTLDLLINALSAVYVDSIGFALKHLKETMDDHGWTQDPMEDLDL